MSDTFDRKQRTPAERAARKAFKEIETKQALTEHEKEQKAIYANRDRLKAERLAREAALADKDASPAGKRKN